MSDEKDLVLKYVCGFCGHRFEKNYRRQLKKMQCRCPRCFSKKFYDGRRKVCNYCGYGDDRRRVEVDAS